MTINIITTIIFGLIFVKCDYSLVVVYLVYILKLLYLHLRLSQNVLEISIKYRYRMSLVT